MMAFGKLFMIFALSSTFFLNAVYLVKAEEAAFDFKPSLNDEENLIFRRKIPPGPVPGCVRCYTNSPPNSSPNSASINEPIRHGPPMNIIEHPSIVFRFSNVGLRRIGQDFISSSDIIDLSLDNNEISDISLFAFRRMHNLRHLNLSGNRISKEKMFSFTGVDKLHSLIIDNNNDTSKSATKILKEYEAFDNLKYLSLCSDKLQDLEIPFRTIMPILSHLYLSNNSISLSNIVFDNIPDTLTHLHLDNNLINQVEQDKYRNLQELNMNNNEITKVCLSCQEQSISLKGAFRMQRLSLSGNQITEVSVDAFNHVEQLMHLELARNKISEVAKGTFNRTIRMISLSLADNILVIIPDVCPLTNLISLNLTGNKISTLHYNSFCFSKKLNYLYLAKNFITSIENGAFFNLAGLKYLDLSDNQLTQLPEKWVPKSYHPSYQRSWYLVDLHLERNKFTNLDDASLTSITSLRNVYLDGNPIPRLTVKSFRSLPEHLTVHMKNLSVDNTSQCKSGDNDKEDDNESDEDDYEP